MALNNYYHILEVGYNASQEDVKLAYRRLAKKYHPDVNANDTEKAEMFKLINEAYKVLSDSDKKAAYDLRLLLGIHEEYTASENNSYTYDARSRTFRYRYYYRKQEPVTYSKKTYLAVTLFVISIASAIWLVPFTLSWYSSAYNYNQGVEYYKNGQYYAALNSLDRAIIDFGSKNTEACILAGNILMNHFGQYTFAIEYANKGLAMAKTNQEKGYLLYMKGLCRKAGANYYLAIKEFEDAKSFWPEYDSLYYTIGNIYAYHLGNYSLAVDSYNKLLDLNPDFTEAYYERAYSHFKLKDNKKAMLDIEQYLSFRAEDGKAHLLKGELELESGNIEEACSYFKRASLMHVREADKMKAKYCK